MPLPRKYFIREREDEEKRFAVKGQGNKRASELTNSEGRAEREAHHLAKRAHGTVEWVGPDGRFECKCSSCKKNK